jgi:Bacterial translation initiation factor IF-2 associated region
VGDDSARSTIKQSFSHGRTRTVEVELKSSRQEVHSERPIIHLPKKKGKKKKKSVAGSKSTDANARGNKVNRAKQDKTPPKRTAAKPSFRNSLPGGSLIPALPTKAQKTRSHRGGRWVNPTGLI